MNAVSTVRRWTTAVLVACMSAAAVTASTQTAQGAAPVVTGTPVYFVHGIDPAGWAAGTDCAGWTPLINALRDPVYGWTGPTHTVGYYATDRNCDTTVDRANTQISIWTMGKNLAWDIYIRYSQYGIPVNVVAHGMGGLLVRRAVANSAAGNTAGYPPAINVTNVVTLSTPHLGSTWGSHCPATTTNKQCMETAPGSAFMTDLARTPHPQGSTGTGWTVLGSDVDPYVTRASATGMASATKAVLGFYHHLNLWTDGTTQPHLPCDIQDPAFTPPTWNHQDACGRVVDFAAFAITPFDNAVITTPANDFSLTATPTSGTVSRSATITITVSTALTKGAAQTINLTATNLPAGATASFTPSTVIPGATSTLKITTTSAAYPTTYPVRIIATGTSATHTTIYTLKVVA